MTIPWGFFMWKFFKGKKMGFLESLGKKRYNSGKSKVGGKYEF